MTDITELDLALLDLAHAREAGTAYREQYGKVRAQLAAVEAVADRWEAYSFYDVAAMQLRNSFTRDLREALATPEKENS